MATLYTELYPIPQHLKNLRQHLTENARCPEQFLPPTVMKKIEKLLGAGA